VAGGQRHGSAAGHGSKRDLAQSTLTRSVAHQHPQRDGVLWLLPDLHSGFPVRIGYVFVLVSLEDLELCEFGQVFGDEGGIVEGEDVAVDQLQCCELEVARSATCMRLNCIKKTTHACHQLGL
jgi:hypothetical protein